MRRPANRPQSDIAMQNRRRTASDRLLVEARWQGILAKEDIDKALTIPPDDPEMFHFFSGFARWHARDAHWFYEEAMRVLHGVSILDEAHVSGRGQG